jgi:hypothetical protein
MGAVESGPNELLANAKIIKTLTKWPWRNKIFNATQNKRLIHDTTKYFLKQHLLSRRGFPPPMFNGISTLALEWPRKASPALINEYLAFSNASPILRENGRIMTFTGPPVRIRRGPFGQAPVLGWGLSVGRSEFRQRRRGNHPLARGLR